MDGRILINAYGYERCLLPVKMGLPMPDRGTA